MIFLVVARPAGYRFRTEIASIFVALGNAWIIKSMSHGIAPAVRQCNSAAARHVSVFSLAEELVADTRERVRSRQAKEAI